MTTSGPLLLIEMEWKSRCVPFTPDVGPQWENLAERECRSPVNGVVRRLRGREYVALFVREGDLFLQTSSLPAVRLDGSSRVTRVSRTPRQDEHELLTSTLAPTRIVLRYGWREAGKRLFGELDWGDQDLNPLLTLGNRLEAGELPALITLWSP
jgi:hypothetical protein